MARFPTFEEYHKRGAHSEGIKRCDQLLAKNPDDVQLLTTKLQLLGAAATDEASTVLSQLGNLSNPIRDIREIVQIEQAVVESRTYRNTFPQPLTAGPVVAKLWDQASKMSTSTNHRLEMASVLFDRAIQDSRLMDAQQALIQLKALQPRNRVFYMAHIALTQMLSKSNEDLQARLALSLARKAVSEKFDDDQGLDCRVPGQIFAMQNSEKDLDSINGKRFAESKQVFDFAKTKRKHENGAATKTSPTDPATTSSNDWLSGEIAALKSQLAGLQDSDSSLTALLPFALNAVRLFLASITSLSAGARRLPADACFITISAFVKLWETSHQSHYLQHAAFTAEMLLRFNPHVHEARLVLVYLYQRLGLGSLAIRYFESLKVKEIQHDTIGHVLFTKLSLLHPHATILGKRETLDPAKRLQQALDTYVRCEDKLADTEAGVLSHGQTGMLFDLQGLREKLQSSLTRRHILLEQRRIARLTKNTSGSTDHVKLMGPTVAEAWVITKDNRDFNAAFDYGYNIERALHGDRGVVPGQLWVLQSLAADCAWCLATSSPTLTDDVAALPAAIARAANPSSEPTGTSRVELLAGNVAVHCLSLLCRCTSDKNTPESPVEEDHLSQITTAIERLNISTLITNADPLAEHLLDHLTYLDVLLIVVATCDFLTKYLTGEAATTTTSLVKDLQSLARRSISALIKHATEQQARIKPATVRAHFVQDKQVYEVLKQFGQGGIETYCEEVAKSAREGWEGVTKVKVL